MEINEENVRNLKFTFQPIIFKDFQISDGMEYPPSYKERDPIDPPQDFENSKRLIKENPMFPTFGKTPPPKKIEKKEGSFSKLF